MAMNPERLWAKSSSANNGQQEPESVFLGGHLKDVYASADKVLEATGDDQLRAVGLNPDSYRERLRRCVLLAAAVHDLGKANDHFQGMICRQRDVLQNPQGLRHEWVTVLMLQTMKAWLLPAVAGNEIDFNIVEWAVSGHHPAHNHPSPPRLCPPGAGGALHLPWEHDDLRSVLNWLQVRFGLSDIPNIKAINSPLVGDGNLFIELNRWERSARRLWDENIKKTPDAKLVAVVKNCLIAADVAGSALPKFDPHNPHRWNWITESFAETPKPEDLQKIVDIRLNGNLPRPFQNAVANSTAAVTFVKAGCGSGKTLAAYLWAAKNYPAKRLYFCYPTTGTATEGFKDYLLEPDVNADLFHSRREIDFEIILQTGKDGQNPETDTAIRIDALDAWSTPIVACTVDAVLGLIQNNKRGLFSWPALAGAAFVFDEIHAFDDRLFGALLRFLRDLPGLPVLLMTASLPEARLEALRETLRKFRGLDLQPISGPSDLEELSRYHKIEVPGNDPLPLIRKTMQDGGKVLWVCNTVNRVMDAAQRAQEAGLKPLIYHSRFKYVDRVQRHKAVIDAFDSKSPGPALAICSQVAEMSLDLKGCTLLVTDRAAVPALIQRLGRLNRQAGPGDPTCPFIVIEPDSPLPYTPADQDSAKAWLEKLPDKKISQRHLADLWEQEGDQSPDLVASAWLDGGPVTTVSELREASPGITVLMQEDLEKLHQFPKELGKYTLPMPPPPKTFDWKGWTRFRGIPVAPTKIALTETISYDEMRGAEWQKQK